MVLKRCHLHPCAWRHSDSANGLQTFRCIHKLYNQPKESRICTATTTHYSQISTIIPRKRLAYQLFQCINCSQQQTHRKHRLKAGVYYLEIPWCPASNKSINWQSLRQVATIESRFLSVNKPKTLPESKFYHLLWKWCVSYVWQMLTNILHLFPSPSHLGRF